MVPIVRDVEGEEVSMVEPGRALQVVVGVLGSDGKVGIMVLVAADNCAAEGLHS